ncbi:MAG: ATP-dependent RecD-like DNA helicase, partial [Candidatus Dependentiae bacterium]
MSEHIELVGSVERCMYKNPENGYTVFSLRVNARETVTVTGIVPDLHEGTQVSLTGKWGFHPKFGRQFHASECNTKLPQSAVGIEKYLSSGLIKGIGPAFAKRLVQRFGDKTLEVIDESPERLHEVSGVGKKRVEQIILAWQDQKEISKVMVFLQERDVSTTFAAKMYKKYGQQTIEVVSANPYRLIDDIWGVGFKSADQLAIKLGFAPDSTPRLQAGLIHSIAQAIQNGHLYKLVHEAIEESVELLGLEEESDDGSRIEPEKTTQKLKNALRSLFEQDKVKVVTYEDQHYLSLPKYYHSEKGIANKVLAFMQGRLSAVDFDTDAIYAKLRLPSEGNVQLNEQQQRGVLGCLQNKISIITGGPGTGKTTLVKQLLETLKEYRVKVRLAAPTGRAAKRMFEGTGMPTETLHRLLEFSPATMGFTRNEQNAIQADFLIVDEASMIDVFLMHSLLKALPDTAHLVLLGDVDQLPSVGAGNVLNDLIASKKVAVTRLTEIFRQAQDSMIIVNAHRVNSGEFPSSRGGTETSKKDFVFVKQEQPEEMFSLLRKVFPNGLKRYGISHKDAVVLTPMNRGVAGTQRLNQELQAIINPPREGAPKISRMGYEFRENDRVMQIRNNYDKFVFNGDIGHISRIDTKDSVVYVTFGERELSYQTAELNELVLAYAISIHKSQGSEFGAVIIPIFMQHFMLLQRNLIYTAITRAKKFCLLAGQPRAIAMGVKNDKGVKRTTFLKQFLT